MKAAAGNTPVTGRSLFYWAFRGNLRVQLFLLLLIFAIVFFRVIPLEMQKRIINESIVLRQFDSLLLYSGMYLLAVTAAGALKLAINYIQARIAEQAILAMRKELYAHIIGMPLHFFRNTQPGMVVSSLMTELNTAGTFSGMALAVPVSNVLTLVAFAVYLLWLNPKLALATLGIYPLVVFLIPYLQKKTNRLNKQRVDQSRLVAGQIAESVTGVTEINVHGAYLQEEKKFNRLVEGLRNIRIRWSLLRFGVKTVNNYFVSLGPFVVFLFGGYLVMNGQLELGSMVAFLSAQEKLYDPWKELIEYYQVYQDASVRYHRVMEYFDLPGGILPASLAGEKSRIEGDLVIENLGYRTPSGIQLVKNVNLMLHAGEHLALVGFSGSGKSTLVHCIAKMFDYTSGSLSIGGREIKEMGKDEVVQSIGYISQLPFIFSGTIRENLLYAHHAAAEIGTDPDSIYSAPDRDQLILALQQAGLFVDVIRFGLNTVLTSDDTEKIEKIIRIRKAFWKSYGSVHAEHIEFYRRKNYHYHSSIAENIIFGTTADDSNSFQDLAKTEKFKEFLEKRKLTDSLMALGVELIRKSMDLFSEKEKGGSFYENSLIEADQFSSYQIILNHLQTNDDCELSENDKTSLLELALRFVPGIHTFLPMPDTLKHLILHARDSWQKEGEKILPEMFHVFDKDRYILNQSILNNIFYGKMKTENNQVQEKISQDIIRLLIEEDCLEEIAEDGMEYQLGSMGNRLSGGQKQKLAIARVLLKDPAIILMDESTSALDNKSQTRIQRLIDKRWKGVKTVIAVVHRLDGIEKFDKIAVMKDGKLEELGKYDELIAEQGLFYSLVHGKKHD